MESLRLNEIECIIMNAQVLYTDNLIIRRFEESDIHALYVILSDEEVNRFLPWYPMNDIYETRRFLDTGFEKQSYAVCLKNDGFPIGYINIAEKEPYDLGYGIRKEFWNRGIITEACKVVIEQAREEGLPYVTATHDRNNPGSGRVMQKIGMRYHYTYEELWQPKNIMVFFRMYQLNLDGKYDRIYMGYWNQSNVRFIEKF